jgi:hypothetical protein
VSVFISHVEENRDTAEAISRGLQAAGFKVWSYEFSSVPGPTYLLQVMDAIENSDAVILVISPEALGSHQVAREVEAAHELDRPIIPVLLGITHDKYLRRRPEWRLALGAFTSIQVPREGVGAIMPKLVDGLDALGVPRGEVAPRARAQDTAQGSKPARLRRPWLLAAAAVLVVALVTLGVVLLGSHSSPGGSASPGTTPTTGTTSPSGASTNIPDVTQPLYQLKATLVVKPTKAVSTGTLTIAYSITNTSNYHFKASATAMTILLGAAPGGPAVQLSDISRNIGAGATVKGTVYGNLADVGVGPGHHTVWIDIGQRISGGSVGDVFPAQVPIMVRR